MDPRAEHALDLQGSIGVLLTFLSNRWTASGSAAFRSRFGLGILDARLLMMLAAEPGVSPARICEAMGQDVGAVSRALRALAERGLVAGRSGGANRNHRSWSLTDEGVRLQDAIALISMQRDAALLDGIDDEDRVRLIAMMRTMLRNVAGLCDPGSAKSARPRDHRSAVGR